MNRTINPGAVLTRVFRIYSDQWSVLIPCAVVVFGVTGVLNVIFSEISSGLSLLSSLLTLIGSYVFTGAIVELVADLRDGQRDASVGELFAAVMPVLGKLVIVGLLAGIAVGIGFVLLVVPGLILLTIWAVNAPVIVLERPPGLRALGRSRELVRGNGWQVFAVIFVLFVLVAVISVVVTVVFAFSSNTVRVIVASLLLIFTAPVESLGAAVLYFELREVHGQPEAAEPGTGPAPPAPPGPATGPSAPPMGPADPPPDSGTGPSVPSASEPPSEPSP